MDDLAAWLETHAGSVPADLAWWLVGLFATQLYRVRRRAVEAEAAEALWRAAAKERDEQIAKLVREVEAERKRTEAIHNELIDLNRKLHTLRHDT